MSEHSELLSDSRSETRNETLNPSPLAYFDFQKDGAHSFSSLQDVLSVRFLRYKIAKQRWDIFKEKKLPLQISPTQSPNIVRDTVPYNIQGIENSIQSPQSLERSELLFRPLMAIDRVYSYPRLSVFPGLKILLIGPRTEYEVLLALGYGFELGNLSAVDLISYSPWITPGDMHALPFADNSFDIIIYGWALTYSIDPWTVAREIVRVARPSALVSVGTDSNLVEYTRKGDLEEKRPRTTQATLNIFGDAVGQVFFRNEPCYPQDKFPIEPFVGFEGHVLTVFAVNK